MRELQALCDRLSLKWASCFSVSEDEETNDPFTSKVSNDGKDGHISVLFLLSVSTVVKNSLLIAATILAYTPTNEHFGIVPLEAMLLRVPVLATDTGGPLETVRDGVSGWLRAPIVEKWSEVMKQALFEMADETLAVMGESGKKDVVSRFSKGSMAKRIEVELEKSEMRPREDLFPLLWFLVSILGIFLVCYFYGLGWHW